MKESSNPVAQPAPVITAPITPKTPDAKPKTPKPLLDDKGELTVVGVEFLQSALGDASRGIEHGLRAFITNAIQPGQSQVGELENAYEAAKAAVHGRSNAGHLVCAQRALETAALILANHSLKNTRDLAVAKEAAQQAASALKKLTPAETR